MAPSQQHKDHFQRTHEPCPCGVSSDAYAIRSDGSGMCFSCNKNFRSDRTEEEILNDSIVEYDTISFRNIPQKIVKLYGVQTKFVNGEEYERAFPNGDALKIKNVAVKNRQKWHGDTTKSGLFGKQIFDAGSKPGILITEGEEDAMAACEMLHEKFACVSIQNGASGAYNSLVKDYQYVDSFDKIYICFDNDIHGKDAIQSIQGLFDFRKVYLVKMEKYKDANEYLDNKEYTNFQAIVDAAKRYVPDNIMSSFDSISDTLDTDAEDILGEYPFDKIQGMTYGLHAGEVIVVKAPEGVGKTEFLRALEYNLLRTTKHPIGIIHLEEDNATTVKAIAGYHLERPAVLPDCGLSKQDILRGYKEAVKDDEGRVHIYSSFDVEEEQAFFGNIRFLVSALGCRFIFLDHITWMATGMDDEDERRKLDRISQKLKLLAKELRFCLVEVSHVNDNGQTRGSRNISKVANTVVLLSRDVAGGSKYISFTLEKVRLGGQTGPAGGAFFNRDKGKLEDISKVEDIEN